MNISFEKSAATLTPSCCIVGSEIKNHAGKSALYL
jgi:hypothetical protein